ncbi:hypothetical protein [Methanosarcina sp.]|nr:hypothetical protein [Methanosarcina sp.]HOW15350.1 hypothetical protein [Methanosarcina sp.]
MVKRRLKHLDRCKRTALKDGLDHRVQRLTRKAYNLKLNNC